MHRRPPTPRSAGLAAVVVSALTASLAASLAPGAAATSPGRAAPPPDDTTWGYAVVSVDQDGGPADGPSSEGSISGDGRFVLFTSGASDLVPSGAARSGQGVYLRDLARGTTTGLTQRADGLSRGVDVSQDGRRALLVSRSERLAGLPSDGTRHLYLWRAGRGLTRVDVTPSGRPTRRGTTFGASLSADGRWVVFVSDSPGLVAGPVTPGRHVYRHDLRTGRTRVLDRAADGDAFDPSASADGTTVVFLSEAGNLAPGQERGTRTAVVWRAGEGLRTVTPDPTGNTYEADLSADGRTVALSTADALDPDDDHLANDLYVVDVATGEATRLSRTDAAAETIQPTISARGRFVAASTYAPLDPADHTDAADVYRYEVGDPVPSLVTPTPAGGPRLPSDDALRPSLSGSGQVLVFDADDPGLAAGDTNGSFDVLVAVPADQG